MKTFFIRRNQRTRKGFFKDFPDYKDAQKFAIETYGEKADVIGSWFTLPKGSSKGKEETLSSTNATVANAVACNLAKFTSMSSCEKVRVFLENFLHEGKAVRYDDYDLDRLESFFINTGARSQFANAMKRLNAGENFEFTVQPTLKVKIVPM